MLREVEEEEEEAAGVPEFGSVVWEVVE